MQIVLTDSCLQSNNQLSLQTGREVLNVTWNFGDPNGSAPNFSEQRSPSRRFSSEGDFEVTAFVGLDCGTQVVRKTIRIVDCGIRCDLQVPNLILPEGTALNARLSPSSGCGIQSARIRVYNRWGQSIFEVEGPDPGWDGKEATDGLYFYEIETRLGDGSTRRKSDWVWLKR